MNNEPDSKEAELIEPARGPNSLVGVKYRTRAEIRKNMQPQAMRGGEEQLKINIKNRPATDPVTYFAQAVINSREASSRYECSQVLPNYDKAIYWGIDEKMPMNDVRKRIGIATYLAEKDSDNWITEEKSDYAIDMITEYIEKGSRLVK